MKGIMISRNGNGCVKTAQGKAVSWMKKSVLDDGGLPAADISHISYQEVTGYTIPTLWKLNEHDLAKQMALWLVSVQRPDGSFCAPDGKPYTFDTGQVVRGLLTVIDEIPNVERHIMKACDWILSKIESNGRVTTPSKELWHLPGGRMIPESIHLYILPPLVEAGEKLLKDEYAEAARHSLEHYKKNYDLTLFDTLSHFYGYVMEALLGLGEINMVRTGMEHIRRLQNRDGSIPAYSDVEWICSTGVAQLAVVWLKLGMREPADKALQYLCRVQNESGGFYGSYGKGANYFPRNEISWGVKYFLDACFLFQESASNQDVSSCKIVGL